MQIGILQTGPVAEQLSRTFGQYGDIFQRYLAGRGFTFRVYDVCGLHQLLSGKKSRRKLATVRHSIHLLDEHLGHLVQQSQYSDGSYGQ